MYRTLSIAELNTAHELPENEPKMADVIWLKSNFFLIFWKNDRNNYAIMVRKWDISPLFYRLVNPLRLK